MNGFLRERRNYEKNPTSVSKGKVFACIGIIAFMIMMLARPDYYLDSARRGLALFATSVLPSLFPFYFFSLLLTYIGAAKTVSGIFQKPVRLLYNAPKESAYVLLLSMLSGYPVGASMTAELYEAGKITEEEAKSIAAFASTSGPVFMLGTVGSAIFADVRIGAVILAAHYLAAIVNGLVFRVRKRGGEIMPKRTRGFRRKHTATDKTQIMPSENSGVHNTEYTRKDTFAAEIMSRRESKSQNVARAEIMTRDDHDSIMSRTIANSTINMLFVGGYIVLCGMLADTAALLGVERLLTSAFGSQTADVLTALLYGLIEMTRGSIVCAQCELRHIGIALCAAIISFGGLSVMLQNYTFLSKCRMSFSAVALRKLVQSVIAFVLALAFSYLL